MQVQPNASIQNPTVALMVRYEELITTITQCYPHGIPIVMGQGTMGYDYTGTANRVSGIMHTETFISRLFQSSAVGEELINWLFMQLFYTRNYYLEGEAFLAVLHQSVPQYFDHWIGCIFTEGVDESGEINLDYDVITLLDNNAAIMQQLFILFVVAVKHKLNHLGVSINVVDIHVTAGQHAFYIEAEHQ